MIKSWLRKEISGRFSEVEFDILIPPDGKMGDYSINLAFVLAKREKKNPTEVGKKLADIFQKDAKLAEKFKKIEFIPPGFINFYLNDDFLRSVIFEIKEKKDKFGDSEIGKGTKINLEFVSANPTGPLTVGNARAGSFADTLGNILIKNNYDVTKEYYVNDVGKQVVRLAQSIDLRMKELGGEKIEFGEDLYQGEYIKKMASEFLKNKKDISISAWAINVMTEKAKQSTKSLGIEFGEWFFESKLHESGEVSAVLSELELKDHVATEDGAKWLKMDRDKKAVLVKSDGSTTYLANDIAYTKNKFERGFDKAVNIWGADHHGDVPRLKAGVSLLGYDAGRLEVLLHQLVVLKKDGELTRLSKRKGNIETLDGLLAEVGKDVVRFFFLTKDLNTHMEFDVDLAKEQSRKNPVFYIQYAFARLNSIFNKALKIPDLEDRLLKFIKEEEELALLRDLVKFTYFIADIFQNYKVHY